MKIHKMFSTTILLVLFFTCVSFAQDNQANTEALGFSSSKLKEIESLIQNYVDDKKLSGAVSLIVRDNKVVQFKTYGWQDVENKIVMKNNSIFRLASITKIFTGFAAMLCYQDGLFLLDDPVRKYIPEFSNMNVLVSVNPDGSLVTEPAKRDITIRDLLRHTAGFMYCIENTIIDSLYKEAGFTNWTASLHDFAKAISKIPLAYQPGSKWRYSYSLDVAGYLVEVVTGKSLDKFMEERMFKPLKMEDTGFYVPEDKLNHLTNYYEFRNDSLVLMESADKSPFKKLPIALSGGGGWEDGYCGIVTTAPDFARFLQMILNYGTLNGVLILKPQFVEQLITNQVYDMPDRSFLSDTFGYGIGVGASHKENNGPTFKITWSGGPYNTHYFLDFEKKMFGILLPQTGPWNHLDIRTKFEEMTYQALIK